MKKSEREDRIEFLMETIPKIANNLSIVTSIGAAIAVTILLSAFKLDPSYWKTFSVVSSIISSMLFLSSAIFYGVYGYTFPEQKDIEKKSRYLFSWGYVPGNDSKTLLRSLKDDFDIVWAESAKIQKSCDGKTISIFKDENSAKIMINEKEDEATLEISDGNTCHLKVKKENGKLNIYKSLNFLAVITAIIIVFFTFMAYVTLVIGLGCFIATENTWYMWIAWTLGLGPLFVFISSLIEMEKAFKSKQEKIKGKE